MEKLSLILILFGISFGQCCENTQNDYVVFFNGSAQRCEGISSPKGHQKQIMDIFNEFAVFTIQSLSLLPENSQCRIHMSDINEAAQNLDLWALRFLDASAKLPSGILNGNLNQFGDFDECLSSKNFYQNQTIQGKYCLANIGIKIDRNKGDFNKLKHIDAAIHSNWILHNKFKDEGHRIPKFETFNVGVCVPASCSAGEVELALSKQLNKLSRNNFINFEVSVDDEVCYVEEESSISLVKFIVWFGFLLIISLVIFGSLVDTNMINVDDVQLVKIFQCFSLKRNINLLTKTSSTQDDIRCIHGARFLNAIALLLSHKQIAMLFNPISNRTNMSEDVSGSWTMIGRAAILYTDSFILFSGLLVSYSVIKDLDNKKTINFKEKLINRLVRLIPNLFGVILFCTYIMDELGSGPQWGLVVTKYTDLCKKNMWTNFLFIHNYFGFENMCLTHTHQLGIDMQLFLVSPIFIYLIWKKPKLGTLFTIAVAALSTWLRYDITYRENLSTLLYYGISVEQLWRTANMSYIMPAHRLTVYLTGIILGYFLRRGGRNLQLSYLQATSGWILAIGAGLWAVFGPYHSGFKEYEYNVIDAARFNAFAPILWTGFLSWGLVACVNNSGGILNDFLNWKYFAIFTRISYAVYLTQFPVFFYNVGTERTSQYYKGLHSLLDLEELTVIFFASVLLTLTFDIPFQELKKVLTAKPKSVQIEQLNKTDDDDDVKQESKKKRGRRRVQTFGI